ncbi:MAG: M28 family peptidase [Verrucomicrobia bacterium]|nr:M28 family peptidase [Verrucomicrobiota bacterium]
MPRLPLAAALLCGVLITLSCGLLSHCGKQSSRGQAAYVHTEAILAFGPRPPASEALGKARAYLTTTLAQNGWVTQEREFTAFTPKGQITFVNLVARHSPHGDSSDLWNKPVTGILCAHLDSKLFDDQIFLGADDAASAAAAILELAAGLSKSPARAQQLELVFFDGEESIGPQFTDRDGLYGSRRYASDWRRQDLKPKFGLLLDMIGHKNLSIKIPSDSPEDLADLLFRVARAEGEENHFRKGPTPILDDHVPLNAISIPTLNIVGDFAATNWWHNSRDNLDNISPDSLDTTIRVVHAMLDNLLPTP